MASVAVAIFSIASVIVVWKNVTFLSCFEQLSRVFEHVDFNNGLYADVAGIEAVWIFVGVLALTSVVRVIFHVACLALNKSSTRGFRVAFRDGAIAGVVTVAVIQAISLAGIFDQELNPDTNIKSLYYEKINARVEKAVDRFKEYIPPGATLRLETNMPYKKRDPAMYIHRALVYHLYPIDLRALRQEEFSHILFYDKRNFSKFVPDDFEVVGRLNRRMGVAARKEPAEK